MRGVNDDSADREESARSFVRDREVIRSRLLSFVERETADQRPAVPEGELMQFVAESDMETPASIDILHDLVSDGALVYEDEAYSVP